MSAKNELEKLLALKEKSLNCGRTDLKVKSARRELETLYKKKDNINVQKPKMPTKSGSKSVEYEKKCLKTSNVIYKVIVWILVISFSLLIMYAGYKINGLMRENYNTVDNAVAVWVREKTSYGSPGTDDIVFAYIAYIGLGVANAVICGIAITAKGDS